MIESILYVVILFGVRFVFLLPEFIEQMEEGKRLVQAYLDRWEKEDAAREARLRALEARLLE